MVNDTVLFKTHLNYFENSLQVGSMAKQVA